MGVTQLLSAGKHWIESIGTVEVVTKSIAFHQATVTVENRKGPAGMEES
jgi:hypothetical protein